LIRLKKEKSKAKDDKPISNSKNKNLFLIYIRMVLGIIGVFAVFMSIGLFLYAKLTEGAVLAPSATEAGNDTELDQPRDTWDGSVIGGDIIDTPNKTNFLIVGTDAGGMLTDVIIAGCFDKHLMRFSLVSIPRDTYTVMSPEDITILHNAGKSVPAGGIMKLNAVHSYAGRESGVLFTQKQVETILGIKIDYYAEVSLQAFRNIVDAIGGIYMDVPAGGLYYVDDTPGQDLVIAVPGGMQLLDGVMAEGIVRYRDTYPRGDLQRIEVQQEFMKQFFAQALTKQKIISNAPSFISTLLNYVKTNFTIADMPKYLKYLDSFNAESVVTYTLPGNGTTIDGASYFVIDPEKTRELVYEVFLKSNAPAAAPPQQQQEEDTAAEADVSANIKKLKIQVLNGASKDGLAASVSEMLSGYGYNVINVGNYYGDKINETRIMAKREGDYKALAKLFKEPSITYDPEIDEKYDIIIILGLSE